MKNISLCFSFFVVIVCGKATAQNLVPNGNFDEVVECPSTLGALHYDCAHWYHGIQIPDQPWYNWPSPDWFHECATHPNIGVPSNLIGFQYPFVGEGYAGLIIWNDTPPLYREIMSVALLEDMEIGELYTVQLQVSRANLTHAGYASDRLGVMFTTFPHWTSIESAVNNWAHYSVDDIIYETDAWVEISFDFVADSSYAYLHIGNFFDDMHTNTELIDTSSSTRHAYYYIDGMYVEKNDVSTTQSEDVSKRIVVVPNPADERIEVRTHFEYKRISMYSVSGIRVYQGAYSLNYNISHLSKGLYFLVLEDDLGNQFSTKFLKL